MDPNQQHDGQSADTPVERLAGGDLLVGADAIRAFLVELGTLRKQPIPIT